MCDLSLTWTAALENRFHRELEGIQKYIIIMETKIQLANLTESPEHLGDVRETLKWDNQAWS